MAERIALTVSLIAFVAACIGLVFRWDRSLFVIRPRFSLRTLMIALAVGPPFLAVAWSKQMTAAESATALISKLAGNPRIFLPVIILGTAITLSLSFTAAWTVDALDTFVSRNKVKR